MNIAFIGLGNMGAPIAGHLTTGGHNIAVFNRSPEKSKAWAQRYGGKIAASVADAAAEAEVIFCCAGTDDDVRKVCLGADGVFASARSGVVFVDHTTTSVALSREMFSAAQSKGISFLDAPSGGQMGAEKAALTIMVGGSETAFQSVESLLKRYGKAIFCLGATGAGQATKMVNQVLVAGIVQSLAEGLRLAERAGLDSQSLIRVLLQGTGRSGQMEQRAPNMAARKFDYGLAADLLRKDLQICLNEAAAVSPRLPVTELVSKRLMALHDKGKGRLDHFKFDHSSLMHHPMQSGLAPVGRSHQ